MASLDLIQSSWVDLIFEGRNQNYGAYVLRKQTGFRNFWSIVTVLIIFACVMVFMVAKNAYDAYQKEHQVMDQVTELSALTQQKKEAKVERKQVVKQEEVEKVVEKVKSSIKFTAPVIKKDDEVKPEDEIKSQDEIMNSKVAVGFANVVGNDETGEVLHAKEVIAEEPVQPKEENKVFDVVEQMPSFPGGTGALMQYLSSHIKYPAVAEENGIQGRVICTFVVGKDGSISNVQVMKSVDPSLDKEAIRVVKSMPNWIPGKQNGSAVNVKYTLPVTFRLQ